MLPPSKLAGPGLAVDRLALEAVHHLVADRPLVAKTDDRFPLRFE
jgi:hypothetical protein